MKLITNTLFLSLLLSQSIYLNSPGYSAAAKSKEASQTKSPVSEADADTTKDATKGSTAPDKADKKKKKEKKSKSEKQDDSAKQETGDSEKADKPEKAEKEKKSKKDEPTQEELEAEKAYKEYQDNLSTLLKQVKTPFSLVDKNDQEASGTSALTLTLPNRGHRSLQDRLLAPRLYLPGRLVLGKPAQFTVKGRPGYWAALAMADRNSGAKPIMGQPLRLGPDRKVVALGKIPEAGVLALNAYCPVAGDLVGANLYFEATVWPEGNLDKAELAQTISSESQAASTNAILVAEEADKKKGVRIVPDSAMPMYQRAATGATTLDSGKP